MGKSSLLNAVLGEMSAAPSSKLPYYRGTVAYVPQQVRSASGSFSLFFFGLG
jgi:ABC-type Mn2+/Zn2+ transport system ATPase subunit